MPKYKVFMQRWVEETGIVEIEAGSAEEAAELSDADDPAVVWTADGDLICGSVVEVGDGCAYFVLNEAGEMEWEREM